MAPYASEVIENIRFSRRADSVALATRDNPWVNPNQNNGLIPEQQVNPEQRVNPPEQRVNPSRWVSMPRSIVH